MTDQQYASSSSTAITKTAQVSISIDHPRLLETDSESIRIFLRKYDQYANEVQSRARQLTTSATTEPVCPVDLKFCVDVEFLESSIALGFIEDVEDYESLEDIEVRNFLEGRSQESKDVVTLDKLDKIIQNELRTNMKNTSASARMQDLFVKYHTILVRHGLKWIVTENQKVAVQHVLSAIQPTPLRERLENDLSFSHHHLKKDFKGFLQHSIRLAEAFQIVDGGRSKRKSKEGPPTSNRSGNHKDDKTKQNRQSMDKKDKPICLWGPHKERGLRHFLKDCRDCSEEEKRRILADRAKERAKDGPFRSTRLQTGALPPRKPTTGCLQSSIVNVASSPSCPIIVSDGFTSINGIGRCDDGSDETIASPKIAETSVLKGIGKFEAIKPITIRVALAAEGKPEEFTFSRLWKVPRIVLELSAGRLALNNISFLVADDALSCEDILIGYPLLQHLGIDSRTLLERNRAVLDGTDCANVDHPAMSKDCGALGRLMIARLQHVRGIQPIQDKHSNDTVRQVKKKIDKNRPRGNYFAHKYEVDPFPDPDLISLEEVVEHEVENENVIAMMDCAKNNGLPTSHWPLFESIIWEFAEIFSTKFSSTPAKVEPLRIELTPDAKPVRVKLRKYSPSQRQFMTKLMKQLMDFNLIYPNPSSKWACAPILVPKPGPDEWRFAVDLRPINHFTKRYHFLMPNVEDELTKTSGSRFFANVDFIHSYWQLSLHQDSQECQSFITPDNVYSPTRVLHGTTNAVLHLQSFLSTNLQPDVKLQTLLWVDDCLFHTKTVDELLYTLRLFFDFCVSHNLKLHPNKCVLFTETARWCGRIISSHGIRHDPSKLQGLLDMECPTTGAQLQQFLCAMQWLRSAIPQFQSVVQQLHNFMEQVYKKAGKRTKRAVSRVLLHQVGWTTEHTQQFDNCKQAIINRTTLAHRDDTKRLCIYTDASDSHWSGIITQVPRHQLHLPHADQEHEPLAFHSGRFSGPQSTWNTIEKEAFAVFATIERSHWLASTPDGFDLYTDHNNLVFIFDPLSIMPDLGQASLRKVLRWAVRLSAYNYVCFHIKGEDNIWADLLTRWSIPFTIRRLISIPPLPTTFRDFEWPSIATIQTSQEAHIESKPNDLVYFSNLWRSSEQGPIWIPDDDADLQLRLAIIAHTGSAGHRGRQSTEQALSSHFLWSTLRQDVKLFVRSCLHCLSTTGGETVPRPYGPSVHGTKPNDLIQFDYIELGLGSTGDKYVLMVRDDHSGYSWFYPCTSTTAETAANALLDWSAAFGVPNGLMSDGPTHFKNETIRLLTKGLRMKHHFTLPYCPWSNGAVERLGKELLRIARALLSELQLPKDEWPQLIPIFQSALNNAPSPQRNNISPITAFNGSPPSPPILTFIRSVDAKPISITEAQRERAFNISTLISHMEQLHPMVQTHIQSERNRMRLSRNKGELANFCEGDYVLFARKDFFKGEKLCLRWRGPRRVVKVLNDYVFKIEDLRNGKQEEVHGTRLKYYSDSSLDEQVILSHVISSETGMPVARLLRLQEVDGKLFVLIRWKGLTVNDDTSEPLQRVYEDVPQMVLKMLSRNNTPAPLRNKACEQLGLKEGDCTELK